MNTEPPKEPSAVIRVKDLYKIYRVGETKVRALNGVSFEIPKGEFVAIVGTSGSGKSTLLNMLAGLEKPTKGEILIGNVHIEKLTEKQLVAFRREKVGFIFQSYNLLNTMNAIENVALPLAFRGVPKKERLKKAREYMELVGVDKQEKHMPNQMSGGQQQRVGIARALVVKPQIIFADEPTGNLDSKTTMEVLQLMQKIVREQNQTLVMVTHDNNLASYADRRIRIVDGQDRKYRSGSEERVRMRNSVWKKMALLAFIWVFAAASCLSAYAGDFKLGYNTNASSNDYIFTTKAPKGNIGKSMSIPFRIRATDEDMNNLRVSLLETSDFQQIESSGENDYTIDYYPFEIMETTFTAKHVGNIKAGNVKSVSLSARVRRDAGQGYYSIPIQLEWDGGSDVDYINIWISTSASSSADDEEDKKEGNYFVVGENQSTPRGVYPNVLDFDVNFRNKRETTAQDITISMGLSEDNTKFPFEINDGNYDRTYDRIQPGESVSAHYSMAIRKDSYTGYYPIKFTITFRLSSEGDLHTEENTFFVHVVSKDKEDDLRDFDANDRTKARVIVDSYRTEPADVYAGEEFDLILSMKNASSAVPASNILFNLESEKVSDSAVFTTESGTASKVVNSLAPGESTEVRARFTAKAGVDQRSYGITVKEKYDSPEFKNAEESIIVDIPVKQYARLSTSNMDVMPDSMTVGSESNVMFGINNTGKVVLYNVTVNFEADSIKPTDYYVGNIKPGETGNVDTMLSGIAATADDGTVHVIINYEDENGQPAEPVEKELTLLVEEEVQEDWNMDVPEDMDVSGQPASGANNKLLLAGGGVAFVAVIAAIVFAVKFIKKRKEAKQQKDDENEIS